MMGKKKNTKVMLLGMSLVLLVFIDESEYWTDLMPFPDGGKRLNVSGSPKLQLGCNLS